MTYAIPRPASGEIISLILDDHRFLETMLREVRDSSADRAAARSVLSAIVIAHGVAEEDIVYPELRYKTADVGKHEVEHGHEEHAEGNAALLELLQARGTDTQKFDDAVEKLSAYLAHHIVEEELTILNPARDLGDKVRRDLGSRWLVRRGELLDQDCGAEDNVRRIVEEAKADDVIPEEIPDKPQ